MRVAPRSVLCAALLFAGAAFGSDATCDRWPEWRSFKQLYLSEDGRVIDAASHGITVSEAQGYALTFALIANDPGAFRKILRWTESNLSGGSVSKALPAWKWGESPQGVWRVLDANSASDADLWILYALDEAARLWHEPKFSQAARGLADLILAEEVATVPGLGPTLLPGAKGFVAQSTWRLNASYAPLPVLRAIGNAHQNSLWTGVFESSLKVISGSTPRGYVADWIVYQPPNGFTTDAETHGIGSYNAIRVYLWAGMWADGESNASKLAQLLRPMAVASAQHEPPEIIDTHTLETRGSAPPGFFASMLPLLVHFKMNDAVQVYRHQIAAAVLKDNLHYYSDVLSLFGLGWLDQRYRFDRQGQLRVEWSEPCRAT
jgi:endo-1,4-beta-D-glucanase Y